MANLSNIVIVDDLEWYLKVNLVRFFRVDSHVKPLVKIKPI